MGLTALMVTSHNNHRLLAAGADPATRTATRRQGAAARRRAQRAQQPWHAKRRRARRERVGGDAKCPCVEYGCKIMPQRRTRAPVQLSASGAAQGRDRRDQS